MSNKKTPPRGVAAPDLSDLPAPVRSKRPAPAFSGPGGPKPPAPPPPKPPAPKPFAPKPPQAFSGLKPPPGAKPDPRTTKKTPPRDFAAPAPNDVALPSPKGRRAKAPRRPVAPQHVTKPTAPAVTPSNKKTPAAPFPGVDLPGVKGPVAPAFSGPADLPAPKGPVAPAFPGGGGGVPKGTMMGLGDLDLPAVKETAGLPAPKGPLAPAFPGPASPATPKTPFDDLEDLPAARGATPFDEPPAKSPALDDEMSFAELDLPAPKRGEVADLPAPKANPAMDDELSFAGLDLPAPKGARGGAPAPASPPVGDEMSFADLDLPAPKHGGADLPAPKAASGGVGFGDLDLPAPKGGGGLGGLDDLDLPAPKVSADLPARKGGGDLGGDLFDDLDLPMPKQSADLPTPKAANVGLPVARGQDDLPVARGEAGFGELDLDLPGMDDGMGGDELDLLGDAPGAGMGSGAGDELDLPLPDDDMGVGMETDDGRAGAGGVGFGEIDLEEEGGGEGMEFADLPQERDSLGGRASGPGIGVVKDERTKAREARAREGDVVETEKKRSVWPLVLFGLILVVGGVGVGLGFTPYGYFGVFLAEQLLPEAGSAAAVSQAIDTAEGEAEDDTYSGARASLRTLGNARNSMGLNRELLARSLVHEGLFQARFGEDAGSAGRSTSILARLEDRAYDGTGMKLAQAADALRRGDAAAARSLADQARSEASDDPYVDLVAGEAAMMAGDAEGALALFTAANEKGGGARAKWGRARALTALGSEEAAAAVDATLEASRRHSEARVAKAQILFQTPGLHEDALARAKTLAQEAAGVQAVGDSRLRSTVATRAAAFTLIGRIGEREGNRREARDAYEAALDADAFQLFALIGAGRSLLSDERWRDALTRFEAAIDTAVDHPVPEVAEDERPLLDEARLGAAQAMFHLDREQDAKRALEGLAEARPEDGEVALWLGRVAEELEDTTGAETHYREAISLMPNRFEPYLALSQLFFSTDRGDDAGEVLASARELVEESAEMRRLLGQSELDRRNYEKAIEEFLRALELDAHEVAARYGLGVAYRRSGDLPHASVAFAEVAEIDPAWPGLALERGLVFEARGESDAAVQAYQLALEDRPEDPDLLLRLGAAYVSDGRVDDAEETLHRVQAARPNSAEVEHFMGRVSLARGNLPVAMNHFTRSIALDPSRGEFHLYVAWAALEMDNLPRALSEVNEAIDLDPSLGDAFWIRGRVRLRGGAVRDALEDLERALQLKPSRYEAYAAIAECYDGMRQLNQAIEAYKRALERDNSKGHWWHRLGQLQLDAGRRPQAIPSLERATLIGDALDDPPNWLSDAHRLLGDSLRTTNRDQAIAHYRRYLEVAPDNALDRNQVRDALMQMGESP